MTERANIDSLFPTGIISDTSRSQYVRQLQKWLDIADKTTIEEVITHPDEMFLVLQGQTQLSEHAKKLLVASICSLLKHSEPLGSKYCSKRVAWSSKLKSMNEAQFERSSTMAATSREIVNWVEWPDVLKKERELARTEYGSDRHLLLSLYCLIDPVRADYGNVRVAIDQRTGRRYDNKKYNHVFLSPHSGKSFLVLHTYKTSKSYGRFSRYLPDELARIIAFNMQNTPREWLIMDTHGHPYEKRNSFTKYVNRVLEELFGKKFTVRMLRHSRISAVDFNETTPKDIIRLSKNMQHSVGMQQLYRRKIPQLSMTLQDADVSPHPTQPELQPNYTPPDADELAMKKKKKKEKKAKKLKKKLAASLASYTPGPDRTVVI